MKKILFFLSATILLASCKSVQKLVDKGDYDGAIELAANKLHGQKNRKTKHVKGLETAFAKVTKRDMEYIQFLKDQKRDENWDEIYDRLQVINARQHKISPFLPLVSKDGYVSHFKFVRVVPMIIEAEDNAIAFHYAFALGELDKAEKGDKLAARRAHGSLLDIERYRSIYSDKDVLKQKALLLGKTRILVKSQNLTNAYLPAGFEEELTRVNVADLNTRWTEYTTLKDDAYFYDIHAELRIETVDVSPEREKERIYRDQKEVKDGVEYVYDNNGNVQKDTLGNDITTDRYVTLTAEVIELCRQKAAYVKGHFVVTDILTGDILDRRPVATEAIFESYSSRVNGDRRALGGNTRKRLGRNLEPFPSDFELIWEAAEEVKHIVKSELRRNIF